MYRDKIIGDDDVEGGLPTGWLAAVGGVDVEAKWNGDDGRRRPIRGKTCGSSTGDGEWDPDCELAEDVLLGSACSEMVSDIFNDSILASMFSPADSCRGE